MARKSNAEIVRNLEIVEALITQHPSGVSRTELEVAFRQTQGGAMAQRTLQRRLERLAREGRITVDGEGPATVYIPVLGSIDAPAVPEPDYVPLSRSGAQVRGSIRRPLMHKVPVGYDPELLAQYRPGTTWYLSPDLRERLHSLGRTPDATRPAGTYAREIFGRLLIDLAWASSRLEGNTYSRLDTQNLLEFGQRAMGKDVAEAQMILNHKAAIEFLVENAEHVGFNRYTLLNLHAALAENLLLDLRNEGRLRVMPVQITGTPYVPIAIPQRIEEYFDRFLTAADEIPDPFEQSFFTMVHLPYLQPFADVNKRTSRLAANMPLIKANLCPLSFVDVPERAYVEGLLGVYELRRVELLRDVFVWAYERSCAQYTILRESVGEPDPFRLRYRRELAEAVRDAVLGGHAPQLEALRAWAASHEISDADGERFAEQALELLLDLHEHSSARYRLRPAEYLEWRSRFPAAPKAPAVRRRDAPDVA